MFQRRYGTPRGRGSFLCLFLAIIFLFACEEEGKGKGGEGQGASGREEHGICAILAHCRVFLLAVADCLPGAVCRSGIDAVVRRLGRKLMPIGWPACPIPALFLCWFCQQQRAGGNPCMRAGGRFLMLPYSERAGARQSSSLPRRPTLCRIWCCLPFVELGKNSTVCSPTSSHRWNDWRLLLLSHSPSHVPGPDLPPPCARPDWPLQY